VKRNSFSMSGDYYVDIDIDYDEALEAIPEEYIRDWLGEQARVEATDGDYDLSDPVVRLEVITQLRAEGYVVEPA
jgi:hypothetical protein